MKPYEFKRFYHPKLGKFVYQHKGSGIIVDNIFKPMKSVVSSVVKKFVKPLGKKALKSGISHAGERVGKKISEKSGDLIMERLRNMRKGNVGQKALPPILKKVIVPPSPIEHQQQEESTNMILNRLISGSGIKRRRRVRVV